MSNTVTLTLPEWLYEQLALQAEQYGVPLENYIVALLSRPLIVPDLEEQRAKFDEITTRYPEDEAEDALREILRLRSTLNGKGFVSQSVTSETILDWANRPYISSPLRERLSKVNALVVPGEGYAGQELLYFPEETERLLHFLRNRQPEHLSIDICIEDSDYKELSQYSDIITLAEFVVTLLVAPTVVNLVSDYLRDRLGKKEKDAEVRWTMIVQSDSGTSKKYTYEGPASIFREEMQRALQSGNDPVKTHDEE